MREKQDDLKKIAQQSRFEVVNMAYCAGSGHCGGSLSCAELLTVLYECYLNVRSEQPDWDERDRFILSKGHAAPMLYATLARKGFFDHSLLKTLRQLDSPLQGHPCMFKLPGVDMSTGSLGLGISVGIGMALASRLQKKTNRIFVLCGDGELQEGQNWEALMAVHKWQLNNLLMIVDRNTVQLDGTNEEVMPMGSLRAKLESFEMHTEECDGHDIASIINAVDTALECNKPTVIIANTVKGKGVSFMEGQAKWHGQPLNEDEYRQAVSEIQEDLK